MIYVRWRKGESRRQRELPPLSPDHPCAAQPCVRCDYDVAQPGKPVTIVAVGPVDDDERARFDEGRWCNVGAVLMHSDCLAGMSDAELEVLMLELVVVGDA